MISSYSAFWPFYVSQHRHFYNRALHFIGTTGAIGLFGLSFWRPWLALAAPVCGYGLAWCGHFFVEHNRPATFRYPLWSLRADFQMWMLMCVGKMNAEVKRQQPMRADRERN